ncbi:MAG: SpaA isopeptide-forming pilin-related protein [Longicatena sp.]
MSERGEYQFYGTSASGNDFTSELVTDVDGKIVISGLLPAHNYYLKEVSTPDGYYHGDKEKIPFTVDSTKVNYKIIENVSRSVTLKKMDKKDNKTLENVEFALFDSNNQRLNGFKIDEIKGKKYYTYTNQVTNTGSLLTLADGTLTIRNLPAGKYYLKEVMALPGYILSDEKHEFELKEDYTNDITTIDLGDIYNLSQKASIRMQKVDDKDTSIPLENAYFQLYKRNTGSSWSSGNHDEWSLIDATQFNKSGTFITANKMEKDALITNDNGDISISSLPEGDYYLKEVKAPNGYLLSDKHYHFTIDSSTTESKLNASRTLNEDVMEEVAQNQVVNQKGKASIKLIKYDRALGASVKVDGIEKTLDQIFYENADTQIKVKKPLKGVVFDLYRKDKETIDIQSDTKIATDLISDKYGEILVDKLEIGTYYFVETKTLDNYQLKRDPIVVEVTQADIQKDSATLVKLVDNYSIEYQIDLIKKDKETNALLQGAHFEMYTSNDEVMKFTYDETKNMYIPNEQGTSTLVTNNEGKISIGNVVSKQTFYFKEIKSPDGYKIDEDNNRHTVTIKSADATYTKEETIITELICTNEKMKDGHEPIQPENPDAPQKPQDPQNRPATMDMKNYYFETLLISGILLCVFYMKRKKYAKS